MRIHYHQYFGYPGEFSLKQFYFSTACYFFIFFIYLFIKCPEFMCMCVCVYIIKKREKKQRLDHKFMMRLLEVVMKYMICGV